jgi:hypothetical protein
MISRYLFSVRSSGVRSFLDEAKISSKLRLNVHTKATLRVSFDEFGCLHLIQGESTTSERISILFFVLLE